MRYAIEKKRVAGVSFDASVLDYLDDLAAREHRDRSNLINWLIREHARLSGSPITNKRLRPTKPAASNSKS